MSDYSNDESGCDALRDDLSELALGILSGRRRSEVLSHIATCPRCSAELEQLSIVADTLLQLAPEVEPPLGFELRLAERLQQDVAVRRPKRFRHLGALAAAALVMIVLGFGIGLLTTPRGSNSAPTAAANLTTANLTSHGQVLGEVMVSAGNPRWVFMTIESGSWSGKVTCELTLSGGKLETIGTFVLRDGYGAWGAPVRSSAGTVELARLITANGAVLASARLPV